MARFKPIDRYPRLLPVVLSEQIQPGCFEFALDHLIDNELDLSALDARFRNDETGASAYAPRVMLKIVLLAYSRGLISSRRIEAACLHNVQFIAISGDSQPSYTLIAKFVRELGDDIQALFTLVLLTCDRLGLIGRQMLAIHSVKLPANANKERSGVHAELAHRAELLDKAARKIIEAHQRQAASGDEPGTDEQRQARISALHKEAQATRDFIARHAPRRNRKGQQRHRPRERQDGHWQRRDPGLRRTGRSGLPKPDHSSGRYHRLRFGAGHAAAPRSEPVMGSEAKTP